MKKSEAAKLIYTVKAAYPKHLKGLSDTELGNMVDAWVYFLEDYTYEEAGMGLKAYVSSDREGFPPSPGQIIDQIHKIKYNPATEMTAAEAWQHVWNAICSLKWDNPEEEFDKLPETCKRAIGTAAGLKEIALMDTDNVLVGEKARFIRQYDKIRDQEKDYEKLPAKVREAIGIALQNKEIQSNGYTAIGTAESL